MAPSKLLEGKVALITGAGSGFGEGIAKLFAEEGAKVIIADVNEKAGQRVASEIEALQQQAEFVKTDVTKEADWKKALQVAKDKFGKLDILVNNAGWTYRNKPSLDVTEQEYDRKFPPLCYSRTIEKSRELTSQSTGIFDINVKGIFHSVNVIVPHFLAQGGGNIINIGSCIVAKPTNGLMWYGATKAAVDMVTRHLAAEFSPKGIRVNGIAPSISQTGLMAEFIGQEPTDQSKASLRDSIPLNRLCTPLDIAKGALYFATPYFNSFQTGILLRVDGGTFV